MTLNDLEWLFYVKFSVHCYEQHFQNLLTVEPIYRIFLLYLETSRDVRKWTPRDQQNIWDPRKNCGSFVDE